MFGVSFPELLLLGTVALLVLGPEKLPGMLRTMGQWLAKLRRLTTEVRHQSGIDDVLRAEGFDGGLNELRSVMRGGASNSYVAPVRQATPEQFVPDKSREYPVEGPDAYGALPEDLVAPPAGVPVATAALPAAPALPEVIAAPAALAEAPPAAAPAVASSVAASPVASVAALPVASSAAVPPLPSSAVGPSAPAARKQPGALPPRPASSSPAALTPPAAPVAPTPTVVDAGSAALGTAGPPPGPASGVESPGTKP